MFTGRRNDARQIMFLITDGMQHPDYLYGKSLDPYGKAKVLRDDGIDIYGIGMNRANITELIRITGDDSKVYFDRLIRRLLTKKFADGDIDRKRSM